MQAYVRCHEGSWRCHTGVRRLFKKNKKKLQKSWKLKNVSVSCVCFTVCRFRGSVWTSVSLWFTVTWESKAAVPISPSDANVSVRFVFHSGGSGIFPVLSCCTTEKYPHHEVIRSFNLYRSRKDALNNPVQKYWHPF